MYTYIRKGSKWTEMRLHEVDKFVKNKGKDRAIYLLFIS